MIIFDALYINNGGGKVLLDYLIIETENKYRNILFVLDKRIINNHPAIKNNKKIYLNSKGFGRLSFYIKYRKVANKIFCFGNVPPPIKCNGIVFTYFHQLLFLDDVNTISLLDKYTFYFKSLYINKIKSNTNFWIVQTNYVKQKLLDKFKNVGLSNILVLPFYTANQNFKIQKEANSFLYVSSGAPHKNHLFLLESFVLFFDIYKTGKLYLTVGNENIELRKLIEKLYNSGYPIYNYGNLNSKEVNKLYSRCQYFIFPSLIETLGLPLLEAYHSGCTIIGINKPYLRNIIESNCMFDEDDMIGLTRIMNLLIIEEKKVTQVCLIKNEINELLKCIYE